MGDTLGNATTLWDKCRQLYESFLSMEYMSIFKKPKTILITGGLIIVLVGGSIAYYKLKQSRKPEYRVCVASRNSDIAAAICEWINSKFQTNNKDISSKCVVKSNIDAKYTGDFGIAPKVLLVGEGKPSIKAKYNDELNNVYEQAEKLKRSVFLVVAGHLESTELPDGQLYHGSLQGEVDAVPQLQKLASSDRLISIPYTYAGRDKVEFNESQEQAISDWINC